MKRVRTHLLKLLVLVSGVTAGTGASVTAKAQAPTAASARFDSYAREVESRLAGQHRSTKEFLGNEGHRLAAANGVAIERLPVPSDMQLSSSMIHHWEGTAFVPGASARDFEALLRGLSRYPRVFAPQVTRAQVISEHANTMETSMRLREQHVVTVWLDVSYDVEFGALDAGHRFALSRSTHVQEITGAGTSAERALRGNEEHGWLWRMNTYWTYQEADGGLYLELESVSLTRAVPRGLGWIIGPYVESIPRDSLQFTLQAVCRAIQK